MGKQGILLEYRIEFPFIRWFFTDFFSVKNHGSFIRIQKSTQNPQKRRLPAATWTQKRDKFIFKNIQIDSFQNDLPVKTFHNIAKLDQFFLFHLISPS